MLKILTLVSLFLGVITCHVWAQTNNPPQWEWARKIAGTSSIARAIAVDGRGNSYVAGFFNQSVIVGGTTLTSTEPFGEGFVAKHDTEGNALWATKLGGDAFKLVVDSKENIYVIGYFEGVRTFGSTTLRSVGVQDFFLVKLDSSGEILWAMNSSTMSEEEDVATGMDVGVDAQGNIYATGSFRGHVTFGDFPLSGEIGDVFILKVNTSGKILWARKAGGKGNNGASSIAVDAAGNSYVTGIVRETAYFGSIAVSTEYPHRRGLFIAKYNTAGEVIWAKRSGGTTTISLASAVDKNGYLFVTGWFEGTAQFESYTLHAQDQDIFLAKYDAAGNVVWAQKAGGQSSASAWGIATDKDGNCYIAGYAYRQATFGDLTIENEIGSSFFATKFSPDGRALWVKDFDSTRSGGGAYGIAVDELGNCYTTGNYSNPTTFGATTLPYELNLSNTFVAKLASDAGPAILTSNLPERAYCAGTAVPVSFLKSGVYTTDNAFTVQLSDATGSFANPTIIGTGKATPIMAVLPTGIASGSGYRIRVLSGSPAVIGSESSIPVSIVARPMAPTAIPVANCGYGTVTLAVSGASAGEVYNWYAAATGGEILATGTTFTTPSINTTTHYYATLVNSTGCESDRTLVTAAIDPALNVQAGSDDELCISAGDLQLTGFSPAGGTWTGAGVSAAGVFNPSLAGAGTHTLTYTYDNGVCAGSSTKVVHVTPLPVVTAGFEPLECGTANHASGLAPLQVNFTNSTTGATAYRWEFGDGATSQLAKPRHTYSKLGSFEVYLTTYYGNGCSSRQQVTTVQVERRNENANVFTPNGDGLNDYFVLHVSCLPIDLKVFDRWGRVVFERANYQNDWDGKNQSAGIYYYQARASNGQTWKGWVEMIK